MVMTEEKALEYFGGGLDCSQVLFEHGAKLLGFDEKAALKISSAFGGGMHRGHTCGCVTGALMAIGLKYGQCEIGDEKAKNEMLAKKAEFEKQFEEAYGSVVCKDILGYDLTVPEEMEKIMQEQLLTTLCPKVACMACEILEEIL